MECSLDVAVENECLSFDGQVYSYSILNKSRIGINPFHLAAANLFEKMQNKLQPYGKRFFTTVIAQIQLVYPNDKRRSDTFQDRKILHIHCELPECEWNETKSEWYTKGVADVIKSQLMSSPQLANPSSKWGIEYIESLFIHNFLTIPLDKDDNIIIGNDDDDILNAMMIPSEASTASTASDSVIEQILNHICLLDLTNVAGISRKTHKIARQVFKNNQRLRNELENKMKAYKSDEFKKILNRFGDLIHNVRIYGQEADEIMQKIDIYSTYCQNIGVAHLKGSKITKEMGEKLANVLAGTSKICFERCKIINPSRWHCTKTMFEKFDFLRQLEIIDCATNIYHAMEIKYPHLTRFKMQSGPLSKSFGESLLCSFIVQHPQLKSLELYLSDEWNFTNGLQCVITHMKNLEKLCIYAKFEAYDVLHGHSRINNNKRLSDIVGLKDLRIHTSQNDMTEFLKSTKSRDTLELLEVYKTNIDNNFIDNLCPNIKQLGLFNVKLSLTEGDYYWKDKYYMQTRDFYRYERFSNQSQHEHHYETIDGDDDDDVAAVDDSNVSAQWINHHQMGQQRQQQQEEKIAIAAGNPSVKHLILKGNSGYFRNREPETRKYNYKKCRLEMFIRLIKKFSMLRRITLYHTGIVIDFEAFQCIVARWAHALSHRVDIVIYTMVNHKGISSHNLNVTYVPHILPKHSLQLSQINDLYTAFEKDEAKRIPQSHSMETPSAESTSEEGEGGSTGSSPAYWTCLDSELFPEKDDFEYNW